MQQSSLNSQYPPEVWYAYQLNSVRSAGTLTSKISGARLLLHNLMEISRLFRSEDITFASGQTYAEISRQIRSDDRRTSSPIFSGPNDTQTDI